jgi:hypothetical protein
VAPLRDAVIELGAWSSSEHSPHTTNGAAPWTGKQWRLRDLAPWPLYDDADADDHEAEAVLA